MKFPTRGFRSIKRGFFMFRRNGTKYNARRILYDGQAFDSKKEYQRYCELKVLEAAGEITELRRQVKYIIIPAQREPDRTGARGGKIRGKVIEREAAYIADFVYLDRDGKTVVEDVKGYRDGQAYALFVIKRKLMLERYGIRVKEL